MSKATNTQNQSKFFRIHVRPELVPQEAIIGMVKDNQIVGDSYPVNIPLPEQWIPNYYEAKVVKTFENGRYSGKFKFWTPDMKEEPEIIEIRYLKNCQSLDKRWQEQNGYEPQSDEEHIGIPYPSGKIVDIPMASIPQHFITFMRHHELNADNPVRDTSGRAAFVIVDSEKNLKVKNNLIEEDMKRFEYIKEVRDSDNRVLNLAIIHGINIDYDVSEKRDAILDKVYADYSKLVEAESNYKKNFVAKLELAFTTKSIAIENETIFDTATKKPIFASFKFDKGTSVAKIINSLVDSALYDSPKLHEQIIQLTSNF
jgi:hypothetical protein